MQLLQMTKFQQLIDDCFATFSNSAKGIADRTAFYTEMESIYEKMPDEIKQKFAWRMDRFVGVGRSFGSFALSIYDSTRRERLLVEAWTKEIKDCGNYAIMEFKDAGSDNSGKIYIQAPKRCGADYSIQCLGSGFLETGIHFIELKYAPTSKKLTYKVADLELYAKRNESVLTIIGENKMVGPNGDPLKPTLSPNAICLDNFQWCFFTPAIINTLLTLPVKKCYEMGGKPCIQLQQSEFSKYFEVRSF